MKQRAKVIKSLTSIFLQESDYILKYNNKINLVFSMVSIQTAIFNFKLIVFLKERIANV